MKTITIEYPTKEGKREIILTAKTTRELADLYLETTEKLIDAKE